MGGQTEDAWADPIGYRETKDLTLSQVKALGRNANCLSGTDGLYCYWPPTEGEPSGFWFFCVHRAAWRPVVDESELPESPWWHDPHCGCGECTE